MPRITRYKFRFYPNVTQKQALARTFGCVRVVYNWGLRRGIDALDAGEGLPGMADLCRDLTQLKREPGFVWLAEVSNVPLQQSLRDLWSAWVGCFEKRANRPRFKPKRSKQAARYTKSGFRIRNGQVFLAKMSEPLDIKWSRSLPSEPTSCTVTLDRAGRYYISFVVEVDPQPLPETGQEVGIDLGLAHFAVLSTGEKIEAPRPLTRALEKLAILQRRMAKKKKGSRNRQKAAKKVARLHARIADMRRDFLHKLSTRLVRENQAIAVEDLNVAGMIRNRSLARSISDAGWGEFVRMLEYKCDWYGRTFVKVDRWLPSSKMCSACSHKLDALPLSVREWGCPRCGVNHDRDVNAAVNVAMAAGLAVSVCGEGAAVLPEQLRLFA